MRVYMRFPGGLHKALTLSYDDGVETDIRLIDIMKKHGLKGTFNLNSGIFAPEGTTYPAGQAQRRMSLSGILSTFTDCGMEVAVHGYTHPFLEQMPASSATLEVVRDRERLEELFGGIIRGMAYPYGTYNDTVIDVLRNCGIAYSRTTKTTEKFSIPTEFLAWDPTCHHNNPRLFELADKFVASKAARAPELFYLWGHSYEFDGRNNWDIIETFAEKTGGHDDIWYATNIEIADYVTAYRSLRYNMNGKVIFNPTAYEVWFQIGEKTYSVKPGEIITLTGVDGNI